MRLRARKHYLPMVAMVAIVGMDASVVRKDLQVDRKIYPMTLQQEI